MKTLQSFLENETKLSKKTLKTLISHKTDNDDFNDFLEEINDYKLVDMHISDAIDYLRSFGANWIELPVMDADSYEPYTVGQLIVVLRKMMDEKGDIKISQTHICNLTQYINFEFQLFS